MMHPPPKNTRRQWPAGKSTMPVRSIGVYCAEDVDWYRAGKLCVYASLNKAGVPWILIRGITHCTRAQNLWLINKQINVAITINFGDCYPISGIALVVVFWKSIIFWWVSADRNVQLKNWRIWIQSTSGRSHIFATFVSRSQAHWTYLG